MSSEPLSERAAAGEKLVHQDNGLEARLDRIGEQLTGIIDLFQARIEEDIVKGQLFEQLHQDLARYRDDFVFTSITRRIFTDLLRLFDRVDVTLDDQTLHA